MHNFILHRHEFPQKLPKMALRALALTARFVQKKLQKNGFEFLTFRKIKRHLRETSAVDIIEISVGADGT